MKCLLIQYNELDYVANWKYGCPIKEFLLCFLGFLGTISTNKIHCTGAQSMQSFSISRGMNFMEKKKTKITINQQCRILELNHQLVYQY